MRRICRERKLGTLCPGIQDQQRVNFYLKLTLVECKSIAMSVSVYGNLVYNEYFLIVSGYNTVSAVFIDPLCECECENPRSYVI